MNQPGCDCNELVTGRTPERLAERLLSDLLAGANQHHIADLQSPRARRVRLSLFSDPALLPDVCVPPEEGIGTSAYRLPTAPQITAHPVLAIGLVDGDGYLQGFVCTVREGDFVACLTDDNAGRC